MPCDHWTDCGVRGGGCCGLDLFGGRPSLGVCRGCEQNTAKGIWPTITHGEPRKMTDSDLATMELGALPDDERLLGDKLKGWIEKWGTTLAPAVYEKYLRNCGSCESRRDWINAKHVKLRAAWAKLNDSIQ